MPIVPSTQGLIDETSAVRLARYAQLVGYAECPFWGVNQDVGENYCRKIWTLDQRQTAAKYLAEAQAEIESVLGYPIGDQWFTEQQTVYKIPMLAKVGYVIEPGIRAVSDIALAAVVDQTGDPSAIGPIATTVTDADEIHVYHPGTDIEIDPSSITLAGGFVTIEIPRCRTVIAAMVDNDDVGIDYSVDANFESTVDVKRVYTDPSTQATLVDNHSCSTICAQYGCSAYSHSACIYVRQPEIGSMDVYPSTYTSGAWKRSTSSLCCSNYSYVIMNYKAGCALTSQLTDAIIRLAHAKMPSEPCGCDPIGTMWKRDTNTPEMLTKERLNCPFGMSDGAWWAYNQAKSLKLRRGGLLA